jgi:ribosomal-protein-alanine N-acetyltransferase
LLDHPGSTAFIARAGEPLATAGFILGRLIADEAEILTLGVCESWQRRGIGQRLVEALGRAARKAEARRLYLEVAASNATAIRLYQKLGFAEIGRRKDYYERPGNPPEDAINLALAL